MDKDSGHVACGRRHPNWAVDVDPDHYRKLPGDKPRLWRVASQMPANLIDHESVGYAGVAVLDPGTLLWWVGSRTWVEYPYYGPDALESDLVFEVLDGPLQGKCVEIEVQADGGKLPGDWPPADLVPVGPAHR